MQKQARYGVHDSKYVCGVGSPLGNPGVHSLMMLSLLINAKAAKVIYAFKSFLNHVTHYTANRKQPNFYKTDSKNLQLNTKVPGPLT